MTKIVRIDDCEECPHFDNEYYDWMQECTQLNRMIGMESDGKGKTFFPIPVDCPLEDA